MSERPLIGIIAEKQTTTELDNQASPPWEHLEKLESAVREANATPLLIRQPDVLDPSTLRAALDDLEKVDAIILPGGPDISHVYGGAEKLATTGPIDLELDFFRHRLLHDAMRKRKNVLGICRGMQEINIAFGGTLHPHLPDLRAGDEAHLHRSPELNTEGRHRIILARDSYLAQAMGVSATKDITVNTAHHQGVKEIGTGLKDVAWAPDGLIEGIYAPGLGKLILGVQWHPESDSETGATLINSFVDFSRAHLTNQNLGAEAA